MGRPREHDERTRAALLAEAERLVASGGPDALSVRGIADAVGTTTRAVYAVFGSKEAVVSALAQRAFEALQAALDELPKDDDPAADLINAGVHGFRRFVIQHPSLFRIAFQRIIPGLQAAAELTAARQGALGRLQARIERLQDAGLLGGKSVTQAALEFNAMCEGLANAELRGTTLPILPPGDEEAAWREALATVVGGFASTTRH